MTIRRTGILFIIVIAQFACVSLWFAGNGVMDELIRAFQLPAVSLGHLTSAVQFGFIAGTLIYAMLAIADRISPSKVFLVSAILASLSNLMTIVSDGAVPILYGSRFLTGFFLAGIYPVGMKIAADYYDKDLGKALGYLLGALVLGTAFPHLIKGALSQVSWEYVMMLTSLLAIIGGALVYFLVPDGPFRKSGSGFHPRGLINNFKVNNFRSVAFGYFGHMWELYAFWAFLPLILRGIFASDSESMANISKTSFLIIGIGSIACIIGGYAAQRIGSFKVVKIALVSSGACCLLSPLIFNLQPEVVFIFLLFWGMMVIMDSPQFSTLVAQFAPSENKASALTIVNCIGFSITIFSIQLLNILSGHLSYQWLYLFLLPGPVFGLVAMSRMKG